MSSGAELKAWRMRLGLKQREVAAILGMSTRGYQDIEQGKANVRPVYFLAMRSIERDITKACSWQPIETAPKDGGVVLLGSPHGAWVGRYLDRYQSGYKPPNPWASMMLNTRHLPHLASLTPTHWMPLPEPPNDPQ